MNLTRTLTTALATAALTVSGLAATPAPASAAPTTEAPAVVSIVMGAEPAPRRGCRTFKRYGTPDDMNITQDSHYGTVEVALTVTYRQCRKRRATVTQEQVGFWLEHGNRMCRDGNNVILYANPTSYGTYDSRTLSTKCYPDLERLFLTWNYPKGEGIARKGSSVLDKLSRCSTGDYGATIPRRANPSGELNELCVRFKR